MKRPPSLRRRLFAGLAVGLMVSWVIATLTSTIVIRHELDEVLDHALHRFVLRLHALDPDAWYDTQRINQTLRTLPDDDYIAYRVRTDDGTLLSEWPSGLSNALLQSPTQGFANLGDFRTYTLTDTSSKLEFLVAEPLSHRRKATVDIALVMLIPIVIIVPLGLLAVWWLIQQLLRPIHQLRQQIGRRGAGDLSPLAATSLPLEIAPIARDVDRLLARIRKALEAERSFTANSAHELRTPLAAALAQIQRLQARLQDAEDIGRAAEIEETLHELTRLSEKLMQLAQAEGGFLTSETIQDLRPVVDHLVVDYERRPGCQQRLVYRDNDQRLASRIDPDNFAILLRNLIENALKHSFAGSPVEIDILAGNQLRIRNQSRAISPSELSRLTQRFQRGKSSVSGSGLGLAIVDAIVRGSGSTLTLVSPWPGQDSGFEARLTLP